jgi:hypothetical protein
VDNEVVFAGERRLDNKLEGSKTLEKFSRYLEELDPSKSLTRAN